MCYYVISSFSIYVGKAFEVRLLLLLLLLLLLEQGYAIHACVWILAYVFSNLL